MLSRGSCFLIRSLHDQRVSARFAQGVLPIADFYSRMTKQRFYSLRTNRKLLDVFLMVLLCLHNAVTVEYPRTVLLGDWFPPQGTSRQRRFPSVCDCLSVLACVLTCLV